MANVTQSLFGFTPQDIQAQRDAELDRRTAAFAQLTPMQQAQASFFRAGSMFGDAAAGALGYEDPEMAQARARQGLLGGMDINDPKALRAAAMSTNDPEAQVFLADRALEVEKAAAEAKRRSQTGGMGTGPERMLNFIAQVDADLAAGVEVSAADKNKANNYREYFARRKTYQMPDGTILTLDVNDFAGQREAENAGGVAAPSPISSTAAPQTAPAASRGAPGVRITETPASQAAAAKKTEAERQSSLIADTAIGAVDKALKVLNENGEWAAGWGSLLAPFPRSAAGALAGYISQIDAQKLITQLTAMRAAAPSGASGLGSLTEKEGQKLIDALGVLRQGGKAEELRANLIEVQTLFRKMANRPAPAGSSTQETSGTQYSSAQEADIAEFMAANPGKSREATIKFMKRNNLIK